MLSGWAASAGIPRTRPGPSGEGPNRPSPDETPDPRTEARVAEPTATPSLLRPPPRRGPSPPSSARRSPASRSRSSVSGRGRVPSCLSWPVSHGGYELEHGRLADALIANLRDGSVAVPPEATLYHPARAQSGWLRPFPRVRGPCPNECGSTSTGTWPLNWHPDWNRAGCWNYLPISAGLIRSPSRRPPRSGLHPRPRFPRAYQLPQRGAGHLPRGQPATDALLPPGRGDRRRHRLPLPAATYGCEYTGQFADWAAAQGIAAVDVELSTDDFDRSVGQPQRSRDVPVVRPPAPALN